MDCLSPYRGTGCYSRLQMPPQLVCAMLVAAANWREYDMTHLPQLAILPGLVQRLQALPVTRAVYLGGSLGRGEGDLYSDLDLQVIVQPSCTDFLPDPVLAQVAGVPPLAVVRFTLGPASWMHHLILASGIIVDLLCRHEITESELLYLVPLEGDCGPSLPAAGTRPKAWAPEIISAQEVRDLVQAFWVTMHKHRRGIAREQELVIWTGIHLSLAQLMRLQFIAATDQDCGDLTRMGIYSLSGVNDWLKINADTDCLAELLAPVASTDWTHCVSLLTAKGSRLCQVLWDRWALPAQLRELEEVVVAEWQRFLATT